MKRIDHRIGIAKTMHIWCSRINRNHKNKYKYEYDVNIYEKKPILPFTEYIEKRTFILHIQKAKISQITSFLNFFFFLSEFTKPSLDIKYIFLFISFA